MSESSRAAGVTNPLLQYSSGAIDGPPLPHGVDPEHHELLHLAGVIFGHLQHGGSVFGTDDVWTEANVDLLIRHFVERPDVSGDTFDTKIAKQLDGLPDGPILLLAELYLLQMLPLHNIGADKKAANLRYILDLAPSMPELPEDVTQALSDQVFNGGIAFMSRRYFHLCVLIQFLRYFRALDPGVQSDCATNPLTWRRVVDDAPGTSEPTLRRSLLYLRHPEFFAPVVSAEHLRKIIDAFYPEHTGRAPSDDPDADLAALRLWMEPQGKTPAFYDPPLRHMWKGDEPEPADPAASGPAASGSPVDTYTVEDVVSEGAFHDPGYLRDIVTRWTEQRNIVLQGPPGTGKTWLAKRLAYVLIGQRLAAAVRSVQFHPGTSYEDFVRGWRPAADGRLTLVDGPLIQHAEAARNNPDIPHVLLIEEFNRGNPAQALGEMLTLLEATKRSSRDALELTYMKGGEKPFWLPDNLHVIGTMNTADRSLALVDFALRRRFAFFDLEPAFTQTWVDHLREKFPKDESTKITAVRKRLETLNTSISEDPSLGESFRIGHAYLTPGREPGDFEPWYRSVVETSIGPQLSEYWPGNPAKVRQEIDALLKGF